MTNTEKTETTETTEAATEKKAPARRKPLWLCIPAEYESFVDDNGDMISRPKSYEIWECHSKGEVDRILASKKIDAASLSAGNVKLFRADPISFKVSSQITIKF